MLYFSSRLPSVRSVALFTSDFGFSFFGVRSSRSAAGGFVAVCGFSSQYAAEYFAAAIPDLLPPSRPVRNVAVRPPVDAGPATGMWRISIPVAPASVPFYVLSGFSVSMSGSIPAILTAIRYSRRFKPSSPGMSPVVAQAFIDWMTFFEEDAGSEVSSEDEDPEERRNEIMDNLAIPAGNRAEFLKWAGSQTALEGADLLDDLEKNSDIYLTAWAQD